MIHPVSFGSVWPCRRQSLGISDNERLTSFKTFCSRGHNILQAAQYCRGQAHIDVLRFLLRALQVIGHPQFLIELAVRIAVEGERLVVFDSREGALAVISDAVWLSAAYDEELCWR